jgi:hypothetical protein
MQRILLVLAILLFGCGTTSKVLRTDLIGESNNDVLILSALIQDYVRQSNGRDFNLHELIEKDSLRRISNSFEQTELKPRPGYISVYYKRIRPSNIKVELTEEERKRFKWTRWTTDGIKEPYDGEIRFDFGERFYRIKRIIVKKEGSQ